MASNDTPAAVQAGYWYCQGDLAVEKIDFRLFTHLFAAFADVDSTYQVTFPLKYNAQFEDFPKTVKSMKSDIKALLSIGGDTDHSTLASMVSRPESRQTFIQSSMRLALENDYDGLSLHWLFPNTTEEMVNLGTFLLEWRNCLSTNDIPPLLTAAVLYSSKDLSSLKYPIQAIVDNLDWINVVAYDIYTPVSSSIMLTGPHAPLYNATSCELSVDAGVRAWIDAGVAANKLVLGLPFLGRSWVLVYANNHAIFSPAYGAAKDLDPIPYKNIVERNPVKGVDPSYVTTYCYDGTTWIAYDGKFAIYTKAIYAKLKGLRGYFAWHLGGDTSDWTLSTAAYNAWKVKVDDPL
ncbi:class V chitinase-like [Corylus avellana]|uniref:class V chitinase-like n=1 Tax=Corylus avellana TaxID=13451 RepID=UPI00286CA5CC|nr:class V chitinase-like [Corylus avellana]